MKRFFQTLFAIEAHLREINQNILYLCHIAERYAVNTETRRLEEEIKNS